MPNDTWSEEGVCLVGPPPCCCCCPTPWLYIRNSFPVRLTAARKQPALISCLSPLQSIAFEFWLAKVSSLGWRETTEIITLRPASPSRPSAPAVSPAPRPRRGSAPPGPARGRTGPPLGTIYIRRQQDSLYLSTPPPSYLSHFYRQAHPSRCHLGCVLFCSAHSESSL